MEHVWTIIDVLKSWGLKLLVQFSALGSTYSVLSLFSAFLLMAAIAVGRRASRGRTLRVRALVKALFPRHMLLHGSHRADLKWFVFNTCVFTAMFGAFLVSDRFFKAHTIGALTTLFGEAGPATLPWYVTGSIATLTVFMMLEVGYYIDHWISHRIPFMWEFHKVHHSAEVLTPFTNSRVHPIESIGFANILAVTTGVGSGALAYAFGEKASDFRVFNMNFILFATHYTLLHLLHTHAWISFTGWFGHVVTSPAHHQLHHSTDPRHFNRNLGGSLMIFDWLFGTLLVPTKKRQALNFGVEGEMEHANSISWGFFLPFATAFRSLVPHRLLERSAAIDRADTEPDQIGALHRSTLLLGKS